MKLQPVQGPFPSLHFRQGPGIEAEEYTLNKVLLFVEQENLLVF